MLLLAFYLFANPFRTMEGLYWLPKPVIMHALKWTEDDLMEPFSHLVSAGFLMYDDELEIVFLPEALTLQNTANPNQCTHGVRRLRKVRPTPLFDALLAVAVDYDPRLAEALLNKMPERFSEGLAERLLEEPR